MGLHLGGLYRVDFFSSQLTGSEALVSSRKGFVSFGKFKHVSLIYSKAYRPDEVETDLSRETVSWQRHTFYFSAKEARLDFEIGATGANMGIYLDHISIRQVEKVSNNSVTTHVSAHVVYILWGSINAAWSFIEDFSPIAEYNWAIDYTKGGTQLHRFTSPGISNFGYNSNVTLIHNTFVHVTVTATNTAEMVGTSYSDPIHVDLTPPDIVYVYDRRRERGDEDAWTDNEVAVNFLAKDDESGIDYCEWAIGYQPYSSELQPFERLTAKDTASFKDFDCKVWESKTMYSTIRCHNRAGLFSSKSSDGVKISVTAPSFTNAKLLIIPLSITEYHARNHYQSYINNVRLQWSGFEDFTGIDQFKITFSDESSTREEKMSFPMGQLIQSAILMNINLPEGLQNVTLQAINEAFLTSGKVLYNLTAVHTKPMRRGNTLRHIWDAGHKKFTLSWDDIFVSQYPLFYEVSVGTVEGGCDILQWQETTGTSITFGFSPVISNVSKLTLYVFVRAINAGGIYEDIKILLDKN